MQEIFDGFLQVFIKLVSFLFSWDTGLGFPVAYIFIVVFILGLLIDYILLKA